MGWEFTEYHRQGMRARRKTLTVLRLVCSE